MTEEEDLLDILHQFRIQEKRKTTLKRKRWKKSIGAVSFSPNQPVPKNLLETPAMKYGKESWKSELDVIEGLSPRKTKVATHQNSPW